MRLDNLFKMACIKMKGMKQDGRPKKEGCKAIKVPSPYIRRLIGGQWIMVPDWEKADANTKKYGRSGLMREHYYFFKLMRDSKASLKGWEGD